MTIVYIDKDSKNFFLEGKLNSWIKLKNGEYWLYPKLHIMEAGKIFIREVRLKNDNFNPDNRDLFKTLKGCIPIVLEEASKLSKENLEKKVNIAKLMAPIYSLMNYYYYQVDLTKRNIFDFLTDLFIRFLTGHYLLNGNKRFALIYFVYVAYAFGYYFYFTRGFGENYSLYKERVKYFVKNLENDRNMLDLDNPTRKEIKKWIQDNMIVGLNLMKWDKSMNYNYKIHTVQQVFTESYIDHIKQNALKNQLSQEERDLFEKIILDLKTT